MGWGPAEIKDISNVKHIRSENNQAISMHVFEDPSVLNFNYTSDQTAKQLPDIQFERIGLYQDAYRTNPPNKNRYRKTVRDKFFKQMPFDNKAKYDPKTICDLIYFNTGELLIQN